MNRIFLLFFIFYSFTTTGQSLSNRGKEFWVGYGHNTLFVLDNGAGPNSQELVLYLSAEQAATVTVSINETAYSQTYNIPANSVIQTAPIPKSGSDDARLTTEGLSTKGIHITSDVPIVAYAHQYGFNSSGATMLMPVETYGLTYYSLNYTQQSNATPAYSWFYVVASENNTKLEITPSALTVGGNPAGVTFNVTLNKGEIYNVFGEVTGFSGNDLTGSKVKSVVGSDGICHPIAVFSGSSRIIICGNSGDVMQQQIFPSSAWGTTYLTYPSVNTNNVAQTNTNFYRIAVRDPNTIVKKNGVVMSGLINNFYYEFNSSAGDFIVADKPILMSQYIPSMQNCASYSGNGDPEMFFLSPLEQSINKAAFYTTSNQSIANNYLVVILRNTGVASLLIDGSNVFDLLIPHPRNAQYRVVVKTLTSNQQHTIVSDSSFNAITYGLGFVESYGYNAGTAINNLEILPAIQNTLSQTGLSSSFTCPKSPFKITVRLAYRPTKIEWKFSQVSKFSPNIDTTILNPLPVDSALVRARLYYLYNLPRDYYFSDTGTYLVPITITAPEIDNCNNTLDLSYPITVKTGPKPFFNSVYTKCIADTAIMTATNIAGFNITRWNWTYDNPGTSTGNPGKNAFNFNGSHPTKLQVVADNGCVGDTIISIVTSKPTATFGISPPSTCMGNSIIFSDTSSFAGTLQSWYWDFGIGQLTAFNNNPVTINFPSPGSYTIKHVANSNSSCRSDTTIRTLKVFAKPIVKFGVKAGCAKNGTVTFSDSTIISDGQTINYSWFFGDPTATLANPDTSSVKNPIHTYTIAGSYNIKLVITTANGCKDSITQNIVVNPFPIAGFTINANAQCKTSNSFTFTNTSSISGGTISYQWSFGDGNTSTAISPTYTYVSTGIYNVKLVVTSNNGCKDSVTQIVTVNPIPVVGFNINNISQCVNANSFTFTNTSTITAGTLTHLWNFGDGNASTSTSPVHTYSTAGLYTIVLVTTTNNGCKDSISKTITVNPKPVVLFTINANTQCLTGNSFVFTNTSTISSGTISNFWSFGDGATATTLSPTHIYASSGTYIVKLVSTSNNGCKDSTAQTITVLTNPSVGFTVSNAIQCLVGNSFTFTNTSSVSIGTITYQWSFGDGGTSISTNPNYTYLSSGVFNVKLIVTSNNGCKDSLSKTVTVNPKPLVAFSINNNTQCLNGNNFTFTNTSSIVAGSLLYVWTFGDGGNSTATTVSHSYATPGTYSVKLIATSGNGCKDSASQSVVINPKPIVSFTVNNASQCINGNSFTFSNTSVVSAGTISYLWSFGDGNTSSASNPTYNYATSGTYQVKLLVTTNNGCKDSLIQTITVYQKPIVGFTINNMNQCLKGNNFIFTNTSSILSGPLTYQWNFGDGSSSTTPNPNHVYAASGNFIVKLIATSNNDCKDSISIPVNVNVSPTSAFTINAVSQCIATNNFQFTNTSFISSGTISYQWNYGDGNGAVSSNAANVYAFPGNYNVKLVATSNNGCKDSISQLVIVNPKPTVSFTINKSVQCESGNSFSFSNTSSIASGTMNHQWYFGDGATANTLNATHSYTSAGIYTIKLVVTSNNGCKDSSSQIVTVNNSPLPGFTINATPQCLKGNNFSFTNNSTIASGTLSYQWNLGDGNTAMSTNATNAYLSAGTFSVKLVAASANGCKDSIIKSVIVSPLPVSGFNINNPSQCLSSNNFAFSNTSTITSGTIAYQWNFGVGATAIGTNANHSYTAPGTYNIKLLVTSNNGCKDSTTQVVNVNEVPTAGFIINNNAQCERGNSFTFTNSSTVPSGPITYQWNFGDGNAATGINQTHVYLVPGTYSVKLITISANGCKDSISKSVTINPTPVAGFNINAAQQCIRGNNFVFTNTSTISSKTMTYQWFFGDGNSSTVTNPTHNYASIGIYTIRLIVTSANGCIDSILRSVGVYDMPVSGFNINSPNQCLAGNNFNFTNTSTLSLGIITSEWIYGDGNKSISNDATHSYTAAGNYTVKLIVTSTYGCKDSISKFVIVNPHPTASYSVNSDTQCIKNNNFIFTNGSTITLGTITYQWSFGDGSTSITTNATHNYLTPGIYTFKLVATSNNGCKDSTSQVIVVNPVPVASFSINNSAQCITGNNFSFTNTSTIGTGTATYQWSFGDGNFSSTNNATHTYTSPGTYIVKLVVNSVNGCKDSISQPVIVNPKPTAVFTINNNAQCLVGNNFNFTNTSIITAGTITYQWSFGDGNTTTSTNANHTYLAAGTYTVKLLAISNNGCQDSVSQDVTVNPKPVPNFTINNNAQCLVGNNFSFTNNSTVSTGTLTYQWNFGDGNFSTSVNAFHTYTAAGSYTVKLVVFSNNSCKDSITQNITVNPMPSVTFTINNNAQCLVGNSFTFTNTSSISSGTVTYFWSFGDGTFSTNPNAIHNYAISGTFPVKLVATSSNGCKDSLTQTITVNSMPLAAFNINNVTQCQVGNNFVFTNTSSILSGTLFYQWSFGDGGTSTSASPNHSYISAGTYTVKLLVTSSNGCKDSISKTVTINHKPTVGFGINNLSQCLVGNNFIFTNGSSITTGTLNYQWSFGDGGLSNQTSPSHTYTTPGRFTVKLIAFSANGCIDSLSKTVTVNPKPTVGFTINASTQCFKGNNFILTNTSTISSGTITYNWTFGDGGFSTATNPAHTYSAAGNYIIKLIVTSGNGCKDSISQTITVNPMPFVGFNTNNATQCLSGNNFVFSNTSTIPSGTMTYLWSFGDGAISTAVNSNHICTSPGSYSIKLIATSNLGCKDSITQIVTVNPMPAVAFTINSDTQCLKNNNFIITNNSGITAGSVNYQWSFGDGSFSTALNVTHNYLTAGNYTVKLVVTSNNGCKDSISKSVVVNPVPAVSFTINSNAQCLAGNNFTFTNTSAITSGSVSYQWFFGDGGTSTNPNPNHIYTSSGSYTIKLIATSNTGCKDSITQTVVVNPVPAVAFTINAATQCLKNNNFIFTNNSSITAGSVTYQWTFGDGSFSTTTNTTHNYAAPGNYTVKLVVTSNNGCKDSTFKTVVVNSIPASSFTINNNGQCQAGNSFSFTNTSTIGSGSLTYQWSFGDGSFSTSTNPVHTFANIGTYSVKLVAVSNNGCKDSSTQTVTVYPMPKPAFNVSNSIQCVAGNNFTFTNTTTLIAGTFNFQWSFGDGNIATTSNASHTYLVAGNYTVKLIAISNNGCKDSISQTVTVNPKPTPAFTINNISQCLVGNSFNFTNTSTISTGTLTYLWSFGDGNFSSSSNAFHSYATAGNYTVKMVAISSNGCKDSITQNITVNPMPAATFSTNSIAQCLVGNSFTFTSTSTIVSGALTYQWFFGDGNSSTGNISTNSYTAPSSYSVKLIATSNNGCKDSISQPVIVNPMPNAGFSINLLSQCIKNNSFSFTNTSNIANGTLSYLWDFGDGSTSTLLNTTHSYTSAGPKIVRLIAISNSGCKDTSTQTITVTPMPVASFTIDNAGQCLYGNNFNFSNTSTPSPTTLSSFWTFGDVGTSNTTNATRIFSTIGTYAIKLMVTTVDGCKDSTSKTVIVHPMPAASFVIDNPQQCLKGNLFNFTSNASISSGTLTQLWKFGDLQSSGLTNSNHHYAVAGNFTVKQFVTSNFGCIDSLLKTVTVLANPVASFTINDNEQCLTGNNFLFSNTSSPDATYTWKFDDGTSFNTNIVFKQYKTAGTFQATLFGNGNNGCPSDTLSKFVTVYKNPTVDAGFNIVLVENEIGTLNPTVTGNDLKFLWTPSKYLSSTTVFGPMTAPLETTTYTLTATGIGGCTASDTINVKVLKKFSIPNAFSPNGDGINDTWIIRFLNDYPGCSVEVFNRFGLSVFYSIGYSNPWNGNSKGGTLPIGTYYYIIDPKNGLEKITGSVTILK